MTGISTGILTGKSSAKSSARSDGALLWVGGYTPSLGGTATGIGLLRWDAQSATLELIDETPTSSPSFLAPSFLAPSSFSSSLRESGAAAMVYATDEAGRIEAFRRGPGGALVPAGGQPTSGGLPCHVSVASNRLVVSNYLDGSIDIFPLDTDGTIGTLLQTLPAQGSGPNPEQLGPHAHSTLVWGSTVLSADLGADRVHRHRWADATEAQQATSPTSETTETTSASETTAASETSAAVSVGSLIRTASVSVPPGAGPRDLIEHGGRVILLGELQGHVFALDASGQIIATGSVAHTWIDGDHAAALAVNKAGRFLYSGLRGSNRIAVIRLRDLSPVATVSCEGDTPRHLCVISDSIHGEILLVANQLSSTVSVFRLDESTGIPVLLGSPTHVASPSFLLPVL